MPLFKAVLETTLLNLCSNRLVEEIHFQILFQEEFIYHVCFIPDIQL